MSTDVGERGYGCAGHATVMAKTVVIKPRACCSSGPPGCKPHLPFLEQAFCLVGLDGAPTEWVADARGEGEKWRVGEGKFERGRACRFEAMPHGATGVRRQGTGACSTP